MTHTYTYHYASPIGGITLASDSTALTGLWFDDQKYFGSSLSQNNTSIITLHNTAAIDIQNRNVLSIFEQTCRWLDIYFSGNIPDFMPAISIQTTHFRKSVWEILKTIPYGQTITYGEIAQRISKEQGIASMSAQAVGGAVGHNPISLIIPCHRVIGADGKLTGYAGGISKKAWLLAFEHQNK